MEHPLGGGWPGVGGSHRGQEVLLPARCRGLRQPQEPSSQQTVVSQRAWGSSCQPASMWLCVSWAFCFLRQSSLQKQIWKPDPPHGTGLLLWR